MANFKVRPWIKKKIDGSNQSEQIMPQTAIEAVIGLKPILKDLEDKINLRRTYENLIEKFKNNYLDKTFFSTLGGKTLNENTLLEHVYDFSIPGCWNKTDDKFRNGRVYKAIPNADYDGISNNTFLIGTNGFKNLDSGELVTFSVWLKSDNQSSVRVSNLGEDVSVNSQWKRYKFTGYYRDGPISISALKKGESVYLALPQLERGKLSFDNKESDSNFIKKMGRQSVYGGS